MRELDIESKDGINTIEDKVLLLRMQRKIGKIRDKLTRHDGRRGLPVIHYFNLLKDPFFIDR